MRRVDPHIGDALIEIGERAARWRAEVEAAIDERIEFEVTLEPSELDVSVKSLTRYGVESLSVIWPALLGRIGVAADWRGTRRLSEFTRKGTSGRRIQLSGGWVVFRRRTTFEVRRSVTLTER
jgi:hypothetical protein